MSEVQGKFAGGVFSAALEGGRTGATLSIGAQAVQATTPDGQLFSVPFQGLELSVGGASGKMWFCRTPDRAVTIFCEEKGFVQALRAAHPQLADKASAVQQGETHAARRELRVWLSIALGCAALLALLILGVRQAGRLSVKALPHSVDVKLGELAVDNMDLGGPLAGDALLEAAVAKLVQRLDKARKSDFKFKTRVVDSPVVNAFALPGGPIVIYTGLLREAASPEQVAAVLAHEMAHVTERHGMQRIAQSLGVVAAIQLLFGDVSGVMAVALEVLHEGAVNSYSRDQEREADFDGIERMQRARLNPAAMADFFALLQKRGGELPSVLRWLGTHPELGERVREVRARVKKLPAQKVEPLDIDWAEVQRHAGKTLPVPAPPVPAPPAVP